MIEEIVKDRLRGYFDEACKELNIDSSEYKFQFEKIGERFATDANAAEMVNNILHINEDWVENALEHNAEFDLMYIMYHEVRHIYQHIVITDFDKRGKSCELPAVILSWKHDFSEYVRNEGDEKSWSDNISQSVEIDANAFANAMLIKHNMDARIAPGQEDIMPKHIRSIAKKLWNAIID